MNQMDLSCCDCSRHPKKKVKKAPRTNENRKCANVQCLKITKTNELHKWRHVIAGDMLYRFCSDNCWSEWLNTDTRTSIYFMSPVSPVTPAIKPYTRLADIPLLNI